MNNGSFIRPEELWGSVGLRANQTVVHLGCGPGFYLIPAARIVGRGGKAIGIDIRSDMLAEVENRALREHVEDIVQTKRGNLESPNGSVLENISADWVLVANILHQADPAAILGEARRIVANHGWVLIIEWDTAASPFGPPAEKRLSKNEVIQLAAKAGLSLERELQPSAYHFGLLLTRKNS